MARDKTDKTDKTPNGTSEKGVLSLKSVLSRVPTPEPCKLETPPNAPDASPYGQTFTGLQRTWTGKVVSLDEWRRLSNWDRHGSTGRMWYGLTQQWEAIPPDVLTDLLRAAIEARRCPDTTEAVLAQENQDRAKLANWIGH